LLTALILCPDVDEMAALRSHFVLHSRYDAGQEIRLQNRGFIFVEGLGGRT
jgi:hypothetical protein